MTVFSNILASHGDPVTIYLPNETKQIRGFVQPILSKYQERYWKQMTRLGEQDLSRYYFFGPADLDLTDTDGVTVQWHDKMFRFLRAEAYYVKGEVSHWEAVLEIQEEQFDGGN